MRCTTGSAGVTSWRKHGSGSRRTRGCRRRRGDPVGDRAGRRGGVSPGHAATPSDGRVPAAAGEAAVHSEAGRDEAAAGDPDGARSSGASGGEDRHRADLRGRLQGVLVRIPAEDEAPPTRWKRSACTGVAATDTWSTTTSRASSTASTTRSLMELVERRISDRRVLKLLRQWLKAGVMEEGTVRGTDLGSPQGGVISPLLANIYLDALDGIWERQCRHLGRLVRYADDFVVLCRTRADAEEALRRLGIIMDRLQPEAAPGQDAHRRARARQAGIRLPGLLPAHRALALQEAGVPVPVAVAAGDEPHPMPGSGS